MGRPRRRPSSCSVEDEGWTQPVILPPLVQRDWRRLRAEGSVFAFAPTLSGPRLSLTVAILAKGMCFLDLRLKAFVHVAV
jgi:hypothetical protein